MLYAAGFTSKRLIKSSVNSMMTDILRSTVEEGNCGRLALSNVPLAGKSGTHGHTVGNRDIWMASYNKEYAMVTWMGFDVTDEDHICRAMSPAAPTPPSSAGRSIRASTGKKPVRNFPCQRA